MSIKTSICILTYNRCNVIAKLLDEVCLLISNSTEVIVVDNNSTDSTSELIPGQFPKVRYVKAERNLGAAGRNLAFEKASGDIIICLDDDVFGLDEEMIAKLHHKFERNRLVGAINFKIINAFSGRICNWVHHCRSDIFSDTEFETYEITEGAVAFRREALEKSGYYDAVYFISHEGPDIAFRIIRNGYACLYTGDIVVKHCHVNEGRVSWLNYYFDTRNHIYLAGKNFPILYSVKYLFIGLVSMMVYSIRDGFFKYWCKAVFDGIAGFPEIWHKRDVLPREVMKKMALIDRNKAPLLYKIKLRLFTRNARL